MSIQKFPEKFRNPKTIFLDAEGTIFREETLNLAAELRSEKTKIAIEKICEKGMSGEIDFQNSLQQRLRILKITKNEICSIAEKLTFTPGIEYFLQIARQNSCQIFVISGGIFDFIFPKLQKLKFKPEEIFCCYPEFSGKILVAADQKSFFQKTAAIAEIKKQNKFFSPTVIIGDGANDLVDDDKILKINFSGNFFRSNIAAAADFTINDFKKLAEIIFH